MGKLAGFMQELSRELKLDKPLSPAMQGVYTLPLDESTFITVSETEKGISFYSTLGALPKKDREVFFQKMLEANLFGQGTQGGILSVSEDGKKSALSIKLPSESNYDLFAGTLEDFIATIDFWQEETL